MAAQVTLARTRRLSRWPKVWQDRRDGANSPWAAGWEVPPVPPENRWTVRVTFSEPGTYVLRALAHDGGLLDYDDVTIQVRC